EDQVLPAAVDVDGLPQVLHRHRRALDVPPRAPRPPWALPRRLAGFGTLPQREVERVALGLAGLDPVALAHLVHATARELAVVRLAADVEVDVAARRIRMALLDQGRDQRVHLRDVAGRARVDGGGLDVVELGEAQVRLDVALAHRLPLDP